MLSFFTYMNCFFFTISEQRISPLVVAALVGLSVMLYSVLNLVPTAVLLGIFLYMGVSATAGIQLLERTILLFVPLKHHPSVPYVRKVRTLMVNTFKYPFDIWISIFKAKLQWPNVIARKLISNKMLITMTISYFWKLGSYPENACVYHHSNYHAGYSLGS